jgi:hypothetical protein
MKEYGLRQHFDNAEHSSDKWEPYFEVYDRHLRRFLLRRNTHLVEVGVQKGGSLDMWRNYLPYDTRITGIDIDPECATLKYDSDKINIIIGDQNAEVFWDETLPELGKIDIFIDDGGHFMDQQILTFEKVFPVMPINSVYICEDTHTSYMPYNGGGFRNKGSFIEYAKQYIDVIHSSWINELDTEFERKKKIGLDLTSVHFYDSMVVFEKFGKKDMTRVSPERFSRD